MKSLFLTFVILFLGTDLAHSSRVCKTEKGKTFAEQLSTLDLNADLKLIDFDFFDGGNVVAGYEYEVEPAYTDGLYARADRWKISSKLVPNKEIDLGDDLDVKFEGGLKYRSEATFIRFINDPCEAMRANPYSPKRMPLKANIALGPKFHVGDYFLFRSSVGLVVGTDILKMLSSTAWGLNVSASYFLEGYYQLHIVRLDEKHVRFKIVGHRDQNVKTTAGLGWENDFEVFEWGVLNNSLERFVNTTPVKLEADFKDSKIFLADYVLDLTNPEVAVAYEAILKNVKNIKNFKLLKPFKGHELDNNFILDLTPLEALYRKDFQNQNLGRIKRNLRTNSDQDAYSFGINAGNRILGYKWKRNLDTSNMSVFNADDSKNKYLLKAWDKNWEGRLWYSWFRSSETSGIRAIFDANQGIEKLKMINLVNHIRIKKNTFKYKDLVKLKDRFKKLLPGEIYQDIAWERLLLDPKAKLTNFGLRYELVMMPEVLFLAPSYTSEEIAVLYRDYLRSKEMTAKDFYTDSPGLKGKKGTTADERLSVELKRFSKLLSQVLDQKMSPEARLEIITELRKNDLFNETGIGFVMTLVPNKMQSLFRIDLNISSNESSLNYEYGNAELSGLYKKLIVIKAALDDDALDILREAESLSVR